MLVDSGNTIREVNFIAIHPSNHCDVDDTKLTAPITPYDTPRHIKHAHVSSTVRGGGAARKVMEMNAAIMKVKRESRFDRSTSFLANSS